MAANLRRIIAAIYITDKLIQHQPAVNYTNGSFKIAGNNKAPQLLAGL